MLVPIEFRISSQSIFTIFCGRPINEEMKLNIPRTCYFHSLRLLFHHYTTVVLLNRSRGLSLPWSNCCRVLWPYWVLYIVCTGVAKVCSVLEYGAKGDGKTLDTRSIELAVAACDTVVLPKHYLFLSAPFNLTSNRVLTVEGTLLATTEPQLWPVVAPLPSYPKPVENSGTMVNRYGAFIGLFHAENVTINGSGTIMGKGLYGGNDGSTAWAQRHFAAHQRSSVRANVLIDLL